MVGVIKPDFYGPIIDAIVPEKQPHKMPIAIATGEPEVQEKQGITLRGDSSDSYNNKLNYSWHYNGGPKIGDINDKYKSISYADAPEVRSDSMLSFLLRVTDDLGFKSNDTHDLMIKNREPAIITVPSNIILYENSRVQLNDIKIDGKSDNSLTYNWTIQSGPENMNISNWNKAKPILHIPQIDEDTYAELVVNVDNKDIPTQETILITIKDNENTIPVSFKQSNLNAKFIDLNYYPNKNEVLRVSSVETQNSSQDNTNMEMKYPLQNNGQSWYMKSNATTDPQMVLFDGELTQNPDGSWKLIADAEDTSESRMTLYVYTKDYVNKPRVSGSDHNVFEKNGYIYNQNDWKNVEITSYIKLKDNIDEQYFAIDVRGERHNDDNSCVGTSYRTELSSNGNLEIRKEQWHPFFGPSIINNIGNVMDNWVGIKSIVYNVQVNGSTAVKIENYYNKDFQSDTWIKLDEVLDAGDWGDGGEKCNGKPDQIITWGGPIVSFYFSGIQEADIRDFSIREISPP
jgi:hypothetical protein